MTTDQVNPEWPDFPSLLDAYLASDVQEGDGLVQVGAAREVREQLCLTILKRR